MMAAFHEQLEEFEPETRRRVYLRLWYELTIAGRSICMTPEWSETKKLEGLKALNEIQHRVWGAHADPAGYAPAHLEQIIRQHLEQAPHVRGEVGAACRDALLAASPDAEEPELTLPGPREPPPRSAR